MKFLTEDFLLSNNTARTLYHDYAKAMPIYDYHCHLNPREIAENRRFRTLTQIWLTGDHYKWRAMRANGIAERLITGDANDREKFLAWAQTVPYTIRNPLYHWTHLELKRFFDVGGKLLNPDTAQEIYDHCNALLETEAFRVREIMKRMNVRLVCTTDDPVDSLEYHQQIAQDKDFPIKVLPAFRPDNAMAVDSPEAFNAYIERLADAADTDIRNFQSLLDALRRRHNFFHDIGCRISDHDVRIPLALAAEYTEQDVVRIFEKVRTGHLVSPLEQHQFRAAMMYEFGLMYHEKEWTMQFHIGALRNNNSRLMHRVGADAGCDSTGDEQVAAPLSRFLDRLDRQEKLPKTILYALNPKDYDALGTMTGNFQDGTMPGKLQLGAAWWFNDQKDGIIRHLHALSNLGLLSRFVGMITDSRSFLSFPRHEYFRRILCNLLGADVENGELPDDMAHLGKIVQDICYHNAVNYFGIDLEKNSP